MHNISSPDIIKVASILKFPTIDGHSPSRLYPSTASTLNSLTSLPKSIRNSFKTRTSNSRLLPFHSSKGPIRSISKSPSLADLMDHSHSPSFSPETKEPLSFAEISPSLFSPPSFDFDQKQKRDSHSRSDSLLKLYSCSQEAKGSEKRKTPMRPSKLLEQLQFGIPQRISSPSPAEKEQKKEVKIQEESNKNNKEVSFVDVLEKVKTPKLKVDYKNLSIQLVTGSPRKNIHKVSMFDKMKKNFMRSCADKELKILTSQSSNILEMTPSLIPLDNQQVKKSNSVSKSPKLRTRSEVNKYKDIYPSSISLTSTPNKMTIKSFLTPKKESVQLDFTKPDRVYTEGVENCQLADPKTVLDNSRRRLLGSRQMRANSLTKLQTHQEDIQARKEMIQKIQQVQFENKRFRRQELTPIKVKGNIRDPNPFLSLEFSAEKKDRIPRSLTNTGENPSKRAKLTGKEGFELLKNRFAKLKLLKLTLYEVMNNKVFSSMPYEKEGSVEFIDAAKLGNIEKLEKLIENHSKYLVYEFNHIHQTALHFAVKKGLFKVALFLIQNGADVDAKDMAGRTPLYLAIEFNRMSLIQLLLGCGADPWITEEFKYDNICGENTLALSYIIKAKMFHVILKMAKPSLRMSIFRKERFVPILEHLFLIEKLK